ncbi:hypothetical protein NIES4071_78440 [Calothrix sp. NIES-4071]|nr:hypothetical protein NIES4071_78440 [Calothrix sp. NIES-4071]BAZ62116.1 hypothetical protein NIES4105_78370 [Calothrix sp. NIES-4105]
MSILHIVVTGNVGAGKTTLIRTISDTDVIDTDKRATDETAKLKPRTTVAMDFGTLALSNKDSLHLYGTPGQARFEFMRDILIQKAQACIVLANATREADLLYARSVVKIIESQLQIPYLIGLTYTDLQEDILSDISAMFAQAPITKINPTDQISIKTALTRLVEQL